MGTTILPVVICIPGGVFFWCVCVIHFFAVGILRGKGLLRLKLYFKRVFVRILSATCQSSSLVHQTLDIPAETFVLLALKGELSGDYRYQYGGIDYN